MSAGRLDPPRAAEPDTGSPDGAPGLASTCFGAAVAVSLAGGWGSPGFLLVAAGLSGGSFGAVLSIGVGRDEERVGRDVAESEMPWFHRAAAAGALGIAATIVLCWGTLLNATVPGYGAATATGLLSYALLASTLPRW